MLSLYLLAAATLKPVAFDEVPIASQVLLGESIERQKRGVERTLLDDRQSIGVWFNGREKEGVEEAIWVSPSMVSRWLGWMQSREGWSSEEVLRRWTEARARFNGKLTFIVRMASFPKLDPVFDADAPASNKSDLADARGVVTYPSYPKRPMSHVPTQNAELTGLVGESADQIKNASWTQFPPFDDVLLDTFAHDPSPTMDPNLDFGIGHYFGAIWKVQCDLPKDLYGRPGFHLDVVTAHKSRRAHFALLGPKKEKPKIFRIKLSP